jgi:excisionase family DNA binding protein
MELCSTRDAAKMLGTSLRTIQLWVDSGLLDAWKTVGGHRRIKVESVKKLLENRLVNKVIRPPLHRHIHQGDAEPLSILVVEDDEDLLKLYRAYIFSWKMQVNLVTAPNGFQGLIKIGEITPDILITDLNMPGMDGFEMIRALRQSHSFDELEVIVVTGLDSHEIESHGGLPADIRIFGKPVPFGRLEEIALEAGKRKAARVRK